MTVVARELLLELGVAGIAAGRPVHEVEEDLQRVGAALGIPETRVAATPTGVFVALGAEGSTGFASTGPPLRFDQAAAIEAITDAVLDGRMAAAEALEQVRACRQRPPRRSRPVTALALLPIAAGVALVIQPTAASVLAATVAAAVVAALDVLAERARVLQVLMPVLAAFAAGCVVFAAHRAGWLDAPLRTALAPIAVLLPGALIVTGMSEVAAGAMVAGAARLAFGAVQVLLLSFGIFVAARATGLSSADLGNVRLDDLGPAATPAGLLLVAVGIHVMLSSPPESFPWMLVGLVLASGVQAIGQEAAGPVLGGFAGAACAALFAAAVHRLPRRVPRLTVFLPSFWLLVPGSLGVLSATELARAGSSGFVAFSDAVASVIAIALGVLVGAAVGSALERR